MSTSYWLDQSPKSSKEQHDVVIIGAGIAGLSTAYWLLKRSPELRIAIVEKHRLAFGASGRNAGFITCGSVEHFNRLVEKHGLDEAHGIWNFSEENLRLLKEEITDGIEEKLGFAQSGSFSLASTTSELDELKNTADLMRKCKIDVEELDSSSIQERVGAVEFAGGIKYINDASVNPVALVESICDKIESKIDFFEHTEAYSVESNGSSQIVYTDRHEFHCDLAISTLNGYSASLNDFFADKIYPTRGQILVMEAVPKFMEAPCYANFVLDYFRQLPSGELLIGGFRQLEKETEVGYSDHTTEKIQNSLHDFVEKYLPQYRDKNVKYRWAGVMGFSSDGQPMAGALPNNPQHFFLGGFTGHGIGLAFHSGKCLSDLIHGDSIPEFLSARRFGKNG